MYQREIIENGERIEHLRVNTPRELNAHYDALAFPGGWKRALEMLNQRDPEIVDLALTFLSVAPRFFRSGYNMQLILRRLKHMKLTAGQKAKINALVLRSLTESRGEESKEYARLARRTYTPAVLEVARRLSAGASGVVRRRANELRVILEDEDSRGTCGRK